MSWSPNYCIHCDKETYESVYCSQSCRLAELEQSAYSSPVSPSYEFSNPQEASLSFSMSRSNRTNVPFHLPPAFNFAAYRGSVTGKTESPPISPHSNGLNNQSQARQTTRHSQQTAQAHLASNVSTTSTNPMPLYRSHSDYPQFSYQQTRQRSLNTSTSRSSLSSISSTGTIPGLSEQALSQLQSYANSFDHVRDWKRRTTFG